MKTQMLSKNLKTPMVGVLGLSLVLCSAIETWAHKTTQPQNQQETKTLKIAIDATYPPMEFEGMDGKPQGFDVDFGKALATQLGMNAEFVVMSWEGILTGLISGKRYDVIISSMNITPERLKVVDFVKYLEMSQVFVSTKSGPKVKSLSDLAHKTVAVQADTTSFQAVKGAQENGVKVTALKAFKTATDAFAALKAGHADVIVIDEPVGRYYAKLDPQTFEVTGRAIAPEPVGIAIRKTDAVLKKAITNAVKKLKTNGTVATISKQWFGGELGL